MSFICKICNTEYEDDELSHDDVCIYCDLNIVDDIHSENY